VRDAILFLAFAGIIPFIFKRPVVGALAYAVVSLMNPHRLTYGPAFEFPFAMLLCVMTLLSMLMSKEPKKLPATPVVVTLILFTLWMTVTCVFSLESERAWLEWNRVMKTMVMVLITIMTVRTRSDVKILAVTVALSLGFWGFKSGLFTLLSGGSSGMIGPAGSYITDNNTLALALVTTVPLLVYVASRAPSKWLRWGVLGLAALTAIAALGSYSRGALLGSVAMAAFLWLKSHSKVKTGAIILLLAPVIYMSMPEQWVGRMHTIDNYKEDGSALGRINAWKFAVNVANHFPFGGGYQVFTPRMFLSYAPNPTDYHVAHSIYFQVLGEHGYVGLLLFLLLFLFTWRTGSRVIRYCHNQPELAWAAMLARMCQVSLIGYLTSGAFLSLAYYDLIYYIIAMLVLLEKVLVLAPQVDDIPPMRSPFRSHRARHKPARG
jgi:putative inorganic carbon (HCO3(-)) transporter